MLLCDGRFRQFNPAFVELMRSTSAQLLGQDVSVLLGGPAAPAAFLARLRAELQSGEALRETATLYRQDGRSFEARLAGRGLKMYGCATASIWVIEDVTEQRLAELAMQQARARLELAQEAGKIGVFDADLVEGGVVWSDKLIAMMGLPQGYEPKTRDDWLNYVHADDKAPVASRLAAALAGSATTATRFASSSRAAPSAGFWRHR